MLDRLGAKVSDLGIIRDDPAALEQAIAGAARDHDLVLTSGGVSTGEADHVRSAVESLPEGFRAAVWLSDAEQFPLRDIAEILGCPLGTVASRLARGRQELRRLLSAYGPQGEKSP